MKTSQDHIVLRRLSPTVVVVGRCQNQRASVFLSTTTTTRVLRQDKLETWTVGRSGLSYCTIVKYDTTNMTFPVLFLCSLAGYCFNGLCPTTAAQCERIWGYSGTGADRVCYEQFNSKGSINGHCGKDASGNYVKCEPE